MCFCSFIERRKRHNDLARQTVTMEANGAKNHHANHKKEPKPKKEFVPHSRTKSYYGHPNPHPHSSNASGPSSQLSPSSSKQPVYQSTDSGTKFGLNSDHTHINNVNKITPVSKHEKTVPAKKDTLKVENLHVKRTDDPKESRKADAKKKTAVTESHKTTSETETHKKSKTNKKEDPGRTPVITVSSGNNYGSTQKAEHPTKNGNNQVLPTDKDLLQASEVQVNARQRPKIQLRRCASVDVAELHRKKKGKKHGKNKLDKDIFLVVSKAEPPVGDILQKDYINTHSQRSNSVGKRPNSLKLSADSNSKSQSIFPTPTLTAKRHSSISKEDKRAYSNAVAPAIEVYDRSPNQFVPQSSSVDRIKKISVDFSSLDEIPPGEGYRRHGLKHNFPSSPYLRIKTPEIHHVSLRMFGITMYSIAAFLVFCPTAAILLVLVPLCYFLKTLFKFCWCCCNRSQGQTCICCICGENLSLTEKFWIQNNHFNPKVVQSLIIVEYGLSIPQIVNLINTRLVLATSELDESLYPRFSQRVVRTCSDYVWVKDESFFIHDHVFAMPKGIESVVDLQDYVSDMGSRPLPFNSALWEVHILTNFGEQQDTVLLLRMHPCLTDGVSLVRVLYKSIADVDSVTTVPPKFAQVSCLDSFKSILYGPLMFFKTFVCSRNDFNLLHGKHIHLSGKKLITWSEPYSLSAAIRIKQVTRSTLSEVLMSVAAGSIRSYLQLNGIPHPYDMHCSIPVYVGADKASTFGNHVILLTIPIPTNTEGIVPRLWQMKEHMIKVKHSAFFAWTKRLFKCSFHVLPESLWNNMWRSVVNNCSCVISCLPGPEIGLRLASKQIKTIFYWYPHVHSIPLTISFFTYGDHVQMAVSADSSVLPNPEILTKDFIYQVYLCLFIPYLIIQSTLFITTLFVPSYL